MPLHKTINVNKTTKVLIWKISESFETLSFGINLTKSNQSRLDSMHSELHQRGFLSVRHLWLMMI
jgi:4'-phosphopantetheinyl transferase